MLYLCNRGKCYHELGNKVKSLEDFGTIHKIVLAGNLGYKLNRTNLSFILHAVKMMIDSSSTTSSEDLEKDQSEMDEVKTYIERLKEVRDLLEKKLNLKED